MGRNRIRGGRKTKTSPASEAIPPTSITEGEEKKMGPVEIDFVHGKDWDEIQENARRIACIPGGIVKCKSELGLRRSKEKGDYFASFVVVRAPENPPAPESPEGTYFRLEDLGQAIADSGLDGTQ